MTKFQLVSDLHIEYKNNSFVDPLSYITPVADILIMAGDIGSFYKIKQLNDFLEKVCKLFKIVIYIPGNCEYYQVEEYYSLSMNDLFNNFILYVKHISNLHILNNTSLILDDICIVGSTLWSNALCKIPKYIVRINDMYTSKYIALFKKSLNYIKQLIKYSQKKKLKLLVITHHCPTYSVIINSNGIIGNKKNKDKYISLYASHLDYLLDSKYIHTWIAGHIHINFDLITKNGTHLVGNQYGKPKDNITDYKKNFTFCIINI
jgi:predicted phosphohydrolase